MKVLRCFPTKVLRCFSTKVLRCFPTSDEVTRISTIAHFGAWVCVSVVSKLHCGTFSWHEFEPSFLWNFVMADKRSSRRNSPMVQFDRVSAQSQTHSKCEPRLPLPRADKSWAMKQALRFSSNRDFKIGWLRTTTSVKLTTAHDQNHVTVHCSYVVLPLRWVVELFHVVATTENILFAFCCVGNSRILSFRKKVFNSPALIERKAKYVSCV